MKLNDFLCPSPLQNRKMEWWWKRRRRKKALEQQADVTFTDGTDLLRKFIISCWLMVAMWLATGIVAGTVGSNGSAFPYTWWKRQGAGSGREIDSVRCFIGSRKIDRIAWPNGQIYSKAIVTRVENVYSFERRSLPCRTMGNDGGINEGFAVKRPSLRWTTAEKGEIMNGIIRAVLFFTVRNSKRITLIPRIPILLFVFLFYYERQWQKDKVGKGNVWSISVHLLSYTYR